MKEIARLLALLAEGNQDPEVQALALLMLQRSRGVEGYHERPRGQALLAAAREHVAAATAPRERPV